MSMFILMGASVVTTKSRARARIVCNLQLLVLLAQFFDSSSP